MSLIERIKDALRRRDHWRKVAIRADAKAEEIAQAVGDCRADLKRKLDRLHDLRADERRDDKREQLADEIEELRGEKDRLLERLDAARDKGDVSWLELERETKDIQRLRRMRRRILTEREGQLTKDFHVAEFDCRDGTPVPEAAIPALKKLCQEHLQPLRDSGGSVSINSGYRTRSYNASIGGASMSYHIYDEHPDAPAADHVQDGRAASEVQAWHEAHNPPDGLGFYATFTHIDSRGYRSRWWG